MAFGDVEIAKNAASGGDAIDVARLLMLARHESTGSECARCPATARVIANPSMQIARLSQS